MSSYQRFLLLPVLFMATLVSACDWVDSAGSDAVSVATISLSLNEMTVGSAVAINESTVATITANTTVTANEEQTFTWSSEPIEQGRLDVCMAEEGFSDDLAVDTLLQACPMGENCEIGFETTSVSPDSTQFALQIPTLFASIGLTYQLTVEDSEGGSFNNDYSFCLIAVNDPPVANADTFVVADGDVLTVAAEDDGVNLLSNDFDDEHIGNTDFSVVPATSGQPENAAFFELSSDGGFIYEPDFTNLQQDQTDSFEYRLTDGVSESSGLVTIRVVATNQAPQLLTVLPVILATEGESLSVDISGNFADPDSDTITFSITDETAPVEDTGLEFSSEGVLSGIPTEADVGSYAFTVIASDGALSTEALLAVEIAAAPVIAVNSPPVFVPGSVFDQTVEVGVRITLVRSEFTDADNDLLTYSIAGTESLPDGVRLNVRNGVLFGTPTEVGAFTGLRIRATDSAEESTESTAFSLIVVDSDELDDDVATDEDTE